ncbi:hypothetical protein Tsubulata_036751 [Turnera subulata]|uniref:FAD synthase n=1 Tax=Turnera subulata TaxID=218843 RepID=A0A9Q0J6Z9_9ROSI|nr:hypothetical protein Tsubulata_036751 [Turnera subulata]
MLAGGSRISQHLRECHCRRRRRCHVNPRPQTPLGLGLGLGFCSSNIVKLSPFLPKPLSLTPHHHQHRRLVPSSSSLHKSPGEIPMLSDCFSQKENDREPPSEPFPSVAGGIVALGKFDALHIGHRELAIQASKIGVPYLLSFVGMAEVLGWEPSVTVRRLVGQLLILALLLHRGTSDQAPIVAKCDRNRVLSSWAPYCGNVAPAEFQIEFSSVRHLSPRQFVEKLCKELGVCGVVAGENYRFGYKAAGDASELVRLCDEHGIGAYIIKSVMDNNQDQRNLDSTDLKDKGQVSSTRVRHALALGDMNYVSELLGRQHRLMVMMKDQNGVTSIRSFRTVSVPKCCLLNLPPKDGFYENCSLLFGDENPATCRVSIDTTHIHLEAEDASLCNHISQNLHLLGVEFGVYGTNSA